MKHLIVTSVIVSVVGCMVGSELRSSDPPGSGGDDVGSGTGSGTGCATVADPFDPATLREGLTYLAADALGGRASNTAGDFATRKYIADAFACIGLQPGGDSGTYEQSFTAPDGTRAANLVGILPGSDPALAAEVIVVGAHHDHLGTTNGEIFNGANDNASGTIAIIAQARALAALRPKRTIGFIAFGYEEHDGGCEGSSYYVDHAPAALAMAKVKYMVNMDMVGTYNQANELSVYGASAGTRGRQALDALAGHYAGITLAHEGNAEVDDSDFQAFANRGVPYVYFETWDEACYHSACDDAGRIDYANLSTIAKLGRDLIARLAN